VDETGDGAGQAGERAVPLEIPSARVLADQASVVGDLQFVMDCCGRLLTELGKPEEARDGVVPLALWSSALITYRRCFGGAGRSLLTADDVGSLPLQGAVMKFHEWIIGEGTKFTAPAADPFEGAKVGAVLSPAGKRERRVEGIAIFAASRVLIDITGVRQLGGLASELAKHLAVKATKQQETVLADAQRLDLADLDASPSLPAQPLPAQPPSTPAPGR
jgi:hypothetical protein